MNERIKELAEQAGLGKERWNTTEQFNSFLAKFSELIVKECQHRVEQYINECGKVTSMPDTVIMKHFGVEDKSIKVGSQIKVISGFNVGAKGIVSYIEPSGKVWVRRDGASSDVFYHPEEVIGVAE